MPEEVEGLDRDVAEMSLGELREHYQDVRDAIGSRSPRDNQEELWDRHLAVWREMESKADADYPDCLECGSDEWVFAQDGVPSCSECGAVPPDSVSVAVSEESRRVLRGDTDAS